ncbi:MAG: long-chain fatty acid transport protein [Saprospiraceae bacterium]|jgi:long-chain fatty acid transport protein
MKKVLLLTVLFLATAVTYAGGYRVSLQGNKALAMGHTGVAVISSSELVFFNPAGLVYLENKLSVSVGAHGVLADVSYQNSATGDTAMTDGGLGTPFYAYVSYQATDWLAFGLGIYTPYGSGVTYEDDWAGSHLVNNIDLQAIFVQPSVSIKITDKFSVGGGPIYATGSVNFNKNLNRTLSDLDGNRSEVTLDQSGISNWGWTASWMLKASEDLTFGMNYRSKIILSAEDGDATFENIPNSPLTPYADTTFSADLPLPAEWTTGLSYKYKDFLFAVDYNMTFWSEYEALSVDFTNPVIPDTELLRNYRDASTYRFGVQYQASESFTLRGGYYFDESPVQSGYFAPETPRNDSNGYTAGLTFKVGNRLEIDASFLYLQFNEVDASYDYFVEGSSGPADLVNQYSSFGGTYKSSVFVPGLGVTYKL